jgi:putative PEP-CTERM system TPR-repeat lipoprotein
MRRVVMIGLPVLALLAAGGGAAVYFSRGNLLKDAQARLAQGDAHGAEIDLDSFLRGHPGNPEGSFELGKIRLEEGNLVAADRLLRIAKKGGYNPAAIVAPLGQVYLRQRRYDDLLADFTKANAPPGGLADTMALRAEAYLSLHQLDQAKQAAAEGVAASPTDEHAVIVAARVDAVLNDPADAEKKIDELLARNPKSPDATLLKIDLMMRRGDLKGALTRAQDLLAANPNSPAAKMATARVLAALDRDLDAIKLVNEVVHRLPKDIGANYLKLRLSVRQRDFPAAASAVQVLLPYLDELPQGQYFAALAELGVNQPSQAQEAAAKYVAQHPTDATGMKLLAFAELTLGRPDRVDDALKPLLDSGHPDADVLDLQARARAMRGDLKGAEQDLSVASAMQPKNSDILNRLGAAEVELGQTAAGEAKLRQSLAQNPDQPRAAAAMVQTQLSNGDIKGAMATLDGLRHAVGDTETVGVLEGQIKVAQLDMPAAKVIYEDVLKRFPESREATLGLVQVEGRLGNTNTARNRLQGWMATHPTDKLGLKLLVSGDMAGRDAAGAIAAAESAHNADPSDIDIDVTLASLYLADKMPGKAVDLIDRSTVTGANTNPALLPLKGEGLIETNRLTEAQDVLQHALVATPKDLRPRFAMIELKLRQKDYAGARQVALDGLALLPGNPRMLEALVAIDLRGHGIKAALATAAALQRDPRNLPTALVLPASAMTASGDFAGAAASMLAAFHEQPSEAMALSTAAALNRAGKPDQGEALLRDWVAKHPQDVTAQRVLAGLALSAHRYQEAADRLAVVLAKSPTDPTALNNMAWVRIEAGDLNGAISYAQRAYYLAPGAETRDTLGWVMALRGDTAGALPLLEQAATLKPTQQILYHYAVALNGQARTRDAKEALDKALSDKTKFDERPQAEKLRAKLP